MAVVAVVVAFLVSAVAVRLFSRPGSWLYVLDHPNERSLHTSPVPRTGGVAILAGIAAALALSAAALRLDPVLAWILAGALLVAGVSFLDDRMNVHPGLRFLVHLGAALMLLGGGLALAALRLPGVSWAWPAVAAGAFSLLFAIWLINLYNFMDGMDGLAGGMAVFGFGTCALIGALRGHADFASTAAVVAAAAAGFLLFNFPPARIFMGDVGSATLGFLAAAVCLWADRRDVFPLWIGVLVFSPFIVDATVTLARRVL
ncbi:MAG TPA: hypothetical protein VGV85_02420, partial [Longimicrobiaceae bacterium]|nr:hypothetical protein [Longimicrobiaceae bacterium]